MTEAPRQPQQERSRQMRADLLQGATRVLAARGAVGFTTNHVAEATGASIGSLYQYFSDKAALLSALHDRDAHALWRGLRVLLQDAEQAPRDRLSRVVRACCQAQCEASELQQALAAAEVVVAQDPDFDRLATQVAADLSAFLRASLPERAAEADRLARHLFVMVTATLNEISLHPEQAATLTEDTVAMLAAWLRL